MDKKIILSIVIVALIGIVAATYQININENLLNPLASVETEESPVTEALAAPASSGDSSNSANNGQTEQDKQQANQQDNQQANQQAAQQTNQQDNQQANQQDSQQSNEQTEQDNQDQSSSGSSGSNLISSDSPMVTNNVNSNNGQGSSGSDSQSDSGNSQGSQSNSDNSQNSQSNSDNSQNSQSNPSNQDSQDSSSNSDSQTNTITTQQAYTMAVKKVNANFNAPVAIDQSSVTTITSNGKTYYVFEATTSDNQLIHIYVGTTPDSNGNVDITIHEDSATINETPDPSDYKSDIDSSGSDPADAEYNITGQ